MNGNFDFNRTPLAPPGTKAILFDDPKQRGTWAPHSQDVWYVGPAREHYRCYQFYHPETKGTRIGGTAKFFPQYCQLPCISSADRAEELIAALCNPAPRAPLAPLSTKHLDALKQLAIFFCIATTNKKAQERTMHPFGESSNPTDPRVVASTPRIATHRYPTREKKTALLRVQQEKPQTTEVPPPRVEQNLPSTEPPHQAPQPRATTTVPQPVRMPSPTPIPNDDSSPPRHPAIPTVTQEEVAAHACATTNEQTHIRTPALFSNSTFQHFLRREFTDTGMEHTALLRACGIKEIPWHFANAVLDKKTSEPQSYEQLMRNWRQRRHG